MENKLTVFSVDSSKVQISPFFSLIAWIIKIWIILGIDAWITPNEVYHLNSLFGSPPPKKFFLFVKLYNAPFLLFMPKHDIIQVHPFKKIVDSPWAFREIYDDMPAVGFKLAEGNSSHQLLSYSKIKLFFKLLFEF